VKDTENKLPFWEGTWKGIANNKEYTFQFVLFNDQLDTFVNNYSDELAVKYKVVDLSSNTILYNDLSITNYDDYKIKFASYNPYNGYYFGLFEDDAHCNITLDLFILKYPLTPNQVKMNKFEYSRSTMISSDCPYPNLIDVPVYLPTEDLILKRQ
jgi:hypothetical protein